MLVVVVDESIKQARVRSRRVLSKYLPQISSATWMGSLSVEGINQLHVELKGKGSKNSASCCFVVRSSKRAELLWCVGSFKHWSESGLYSFKESRVL